MGVSASKEENDKIIKLAEEDKRRTKERKEYNDKVNEEWKKCQDQRAELDRKIDIDTDKNILASAIDCKCCGNKTNNYLGIELCYNCIIGQFMHYTNSVLESDLTKYSRHCLKCKTFVDKEHDIGLLDCHINTFQNLYVGYRCRHINKIIISNEYMHILHFRNYKQSSSLCCFIDKFGTWTYGICNNCIYNDFIEILKNYVDNCKKSFINV